MGLSVGLGIMVLLLQDHGSISTENAAQATNLKYKTRQNCRIDVNYIMEKYTAESLSDCVTTCTVTSECISVAWNRKNSVCMLSDQDTIFERSLDRRFYIQAEDWTCASLIIFPVFSAMDATYATERYEMTFTRASARCAELGTRLADPSDLTKAQNLGLSMCNCGWMSDGNMAVLLDSIDLLCPFFYNKGPIMCVGLFALVDAWCLMPNY